MSICSCVVHTRPERGEEVSASLNEIAGVEVHGGQSVGKLVVTVEDTAESKAADTLGAIGAVEGVINTVLIYHYGGEDIEQSIPKEGHP
jgi:nitrate reductase NapD